MGGKECSVSNYVVPTKWKVVLIVHIHVPARHVRCYMSITSFNLSCVLKL